MTRLALLFGSHPPVQEDDPGVAIVSGPQSQPEILRRVTGIKGSRGLRPVFHHREDRIRSHVQLCWLALLLIRVVENATGDTWRNVRRELDRMHLVTMETAEGRVAQRTTTTFGQAEILAKLDIAECPWPRTGDPARFLNFELPTPSA